MTTLKDLAAAAGVSIRTVNRVLQNRGYVGTAARGAVDSAVRKLGYRPNLAARALKTAKSHVVSVLAFTTDELRMTQVAAFEQALRRANYLVSVAFQFELDQPAKGAQTLRELIGQQPAGIALVGHDAYVLRKILPSLMPTLVRSQIPYIILDPRGETSYDAVKIDRGSGVREAVFHLASRGAKRIAFLGPPDDRTRLDAYEKTLRDLQRPAHLLKFPGLGISALRETGRKTAVLKHNRPDAVIAHADHIALPFLAGLHDQGVRVPDEIAVIGFDDRPAAALAWPALTTIAQPGLELGSGAAEILLSKITREGEPPGGWSRTFPTRLVLRETA
jgi:DNA-binding LacI/PurR family transcriptional regulator